jgi:hypothetical protein
MMQRSATATSVQVVGSGRRRRSVTDVADANAGKTDLQLSELLAELTLDMCRKSFCLSCPECVARQARVDRAAFESRRTLVTQLTGAIDASVAMGVPLDAASLAVLLRLPSTIRAEVWLELLGARNLRRKSPGVYERLLAFSSEQSQRIVRDVGRTFPAHPLFDDGAPGQVALLNVLRAYSIFDSELGYCQGMSFIVGMLLLLGMREEEAFWAFVALIKDRKLHGLFADQLPLLKTLLYQFDRLIELRMAKLFSHFKENNVTPLLYASEWFSTVFCYGFALPTSFRIWDMFLVHGTSFLLRTALAVLVLSQEQLLKMGFDELLVFFKRDAQALPPAELINAALSITLDAALLDQLAQEHDHPATQSYLGSMVWN